MLPFPIPVPDSPELEREIDDVVAACGGDARAALRSLVVANSFLAGELEALLAAASRGYTRGGGGRRAARQSKDDQELEG